MFDASRLAARSFANKPKDMSYRDYRPSPVDLQSIESTIPLAAIQSAFSACVTISEACVGLSNGSSSWPLVKLYYSAYYSLRCLLLLNGIVPFNERGEMLIDVREQKYLKGGSSSHSWNWNSLRQVGRISREWYLSEEACCAYDKLRSHREDSNYRHGFPEPNVQHSLSNGESNVWKRFRIYKQDDDFFYTYLPDHLVLAFPVRLTFLAAATLSERKLSFGDAQIQYLQKTWHGKDKCPFIGM